ncbi:transcriptional regulator [Adhaeribacter arboris]|uniref:Transcriptional regulator n=1 Tax=Adhaeribacter arboris TaxID=2072846 RepID=A0A2T2YAB4_9BACT|nr:DegT/DnrJ/EryC1/StrS family aminotransferase [Adhaeribacter arboris]PSR52447.1 transcriptional regulator [Adhaeribacter arboris]
MNPIRLSDVSDSCALLKPALENAFAQVLAEGNFIKGAPVAEFVHYLSEYLQGPQVIPCGNGTDALQIALMALDLPPGSEVIVPVFNYVSAVEAIALLGLVPVFADVLPGTFTIDPDSAAAKISYKTRAIIAVHLFGQCADLKALTELARKHDLFLMEDNAQSLGAQFVAANGFRYFAGTVGHIGTTSFFPTKMLGALGDGGALFTKDEDLATILRQIASHGQSRKYTYERIGVNSRLDTLQAAFLSIKLKYLNANIGQRQLLAQKYDQNLQESHFIQVPKRADYSTHVFNQYVVQVPAGHRNNLRAFLLQKQIPTAVYYATPLHLQPAYQYLGNFAGDFPVAENICQKVIALPLHPSLTLEQADYISSSIQEYVQKVS